QLRAWRARGCGGDRRDLPRGRRLVRRGCGAGADVRGARVARPPVTAFLQHGRRDRPCAGLPVVAEPEETIRRRLAQLGVRISPEELWGLASPYPAWGRRV